MRIYRYPWGRYISSLGYIVSLPGKIHKLPEEEHISYINSPGKTEEHTTVEILKGRIFLHQHRDMATVSPSYRESGSVISLPTRSIAW
jgi:hypothetical protein